MTERKLKQILAFVIGVPLSLGVYALAIAAGLSGTFACLAAIFALGLIFMLLRKLGLNLIDM